MFCGGGGVLLGGFWLGGWVFRGGEWGGLALRFSRGGGVGAEAKA